MERNLDRKTLSFGKGMTNIPSDLLSDDSELLESVGFIYRDGEMKPVQKPKLIGNIPYKIMYVHKQADYENIIAYDEAGTIHWYQKDTDGHISEEQDSFNVGTVTDIKSVGNTLICATDQGLHYLLFKGGVYKDLGAELPKPKVEFKFTEVENPFKANDGRTVLKIASFFADYRTYDAGMYYDAQGKFIGAYTSAPSSYAYKYPNEFGIHAIENSKLDDFRNAVQGHVAEAINWAKEKGYFCFPFFARFALRLFDGSYARISNPIICYPTISKNCEIRYATSDKKYTDNSGVEQWQGNITPNNVFVGTCDDYFYFIHCTKMLCSVSIPGVDSWKDIVKELVVFASDDVLPFKLDGKYWSFDEYFKNNGETIYNTLLNGTYVEKLTSFHVEKGKLSTSLYDDQQNPYQGIEPTYKTDAEIKAELLQKSQFYKLFSIDVDDNITNSGTFIDTLSTSSRQALVNGQILKTLTEQEQLKVDDYYGWTTIHSDKLYTYNQRLNLIGAKRFPFEGFNVFRANNGSESNGNVGYVKFYVHISSATMDTWVSSPVCFIKESFAVYNDWYYYPDPNAKEMVIFVNNIASGRQDYYRVQLKIHPLLNGSYSFNNLPPSSISNKGNVSMTFGGFEDLNSQIFTSVVNNPFVFEASGDNTVGTGKILGIVANTEAVSQGQFGQYPLMVFTDEGIYGMSVNSEGLYSATYPISREVCLENSPLVPTDRLIFFASKKGLMAASGGSVGCMSELLRGRAPINFTTLGEGKFLDFLKDCQIAYDYKDSMLRIFSEGKPYQYIYNMVDKTFSMVNSGITARSVVNDYPDNLIQGTDGSIYSLTGKPEINDDTNTYDGTITTRPLKLGGSMTLKSLRNIKNLRSTQTGKLQLEVWGSNNAMNWCKLRSLTGKPWAYFTFRYTLSDFKACDSFVGSIVDIQNRREQR